ncbi:hypothetical protein GCM10020255_003550 [Rhodococcus baikonurensis]
MSNPSQTGQADPGLPGLADQLAGYLEFIDAAVRRHLDDPVIVFIRWLHSHQSVGHDATFLPRHTEGGKATYTVLTTVPHSAIGRNVPFSRLTNVPGQYS